MPVTVAVALIAVALIAGLVAGAGAVYAAHLRWADEHHYRRVRLEAARVRDLYRTSDHYLRTAKRAVDALRAQRGIYHLMVGDLLDKVAEQARQLDHLARRRPPYSPDVWDYGARRAS
jgi:hypothetical protein